ncbi:MAG: Rieske 2Fe-2S domain-containing protein [Phycisphaerae bacterium]|nr:Rieske 2Fe-2S domain-containing protein [Phycisphaerae bacterium]
MRTLLKRMPSHRWCLLGLGILLAGLAGCSSFKYVNQTPTIKAEAYAVGKDGELKITLAKVPELAKVGGAVSVMDPNLPDLLIIARTADSEYVVASSKCPHRAMALAYSHEDQCFKCSSMGGGKYALDGKKIGGPGSGTLTIYPCAVEQGVLVVDAKGK